MWIAGNQIGSVLTFGFGQVGDSRIAGYFWCLGEGGWLWGRERGVRLRLAISSQLGGPWRYWGSACLIPEAQAQMGPSALEWGGFSLWIIWEGVSRGLCPAADLLPETV